MEISYPDLAAHFHTASLRIVLEPIVYSAILRVPSHIAMDWCRRIPSAYRALGARRCQSLRDQLLLLQKQTKPRPTAAVCRGHAPLSITAGSRLYCRHAPHARDHWFAGALYETVKNSDEFGIVLKKCTPV